MRIPYTHYTNGLKNTRSKHGAFAPFFYEQLQGYKCLKTIHLLYNGFDDMRHGSLFSGIGGFDLAAEWMGWENVFHCDINSFCQTVLKYYWPNAKSYEDIKETDFSIYRGKIDILTGGFPCQPYSLAGKRKGTDDERHLWPEMLRAIREIQPRWIVGENVFGIVNWSDGLVFEEVQANLETEGYKVQPFILPACAVNAPHKRDRIWFVAYSNNKGGNSGFGKISRKNEKVSERNKSSESCHTNCWATTYSNVLRNNNSQKSKRSFWQQQSFIKSGDRRKLQIGGFGSKQSTSNSNHTRLQRSENRGGVRRIWKEQKKFVTRRIRSNWENFPTQSPICSGNDGIPYGLVGITIPKHRNESIKGYGNAIVPQVVFQIFKAIQNYEQLYKL